MATAHKDRLSAIDASFLHQERESSHMHVGAVTIFDGPPPSADELREHLEARLHLVPRYRQKLAYPPLGLGRPFWVDDAQFNLEFHVRVTGLPRPGDEHQLRKQAGRIFSQRLDRTKPLWELWLIQGLEDGRFAMISKNHHALVDGVAGVDIATVLFDLSPQPSEVPEGEQEWSPHGEPSAVELTAELARDVAKAPLGLAGGAVRALGSPRRAAETTVEAAQGLGEVAWAGFNPAPETPLNVPISSHRRIAWVRSELESFRAIKNALGGTVNDVVLSAVTGGLRRFLIDRGVRVEGLELRALVPVSIRTEDQQGALGNQIAVMRGPLPVYCDDPVDCLRIVREEMRGLKESKQALGAEVIAGLTGFAPPTLLAQASRLNFSTRLFNLIVTNVPGPQFPLYMLGRELEEIFPIAFLPENHALAIAIMSYNGSIDFGLLGDYEAVDDLDTVARYIGESVDGLLDAAAAAKPVVPGSRRAGARRSGARSARAAQAERG